MSALSDRLSKPTVQLLELLAVHKTYKLLKQAHPQITDKQIKNAQAELLRVKGVSTTSHQAVFRETFTVATTILREQTVRPPKTAYQLRITLLESEPEIWRRFIVPGDITLERMHFVIQDVMGWQECHPHRFTIEGKDYMAAGEGGMGDEIEAEDESEHRLGDLLQREHMQFRYEYDFGDGWEHLLTVENIISGGDKPKTFVCLAGQGHCPPEDCGGLAGYYRMLEILKDGEDEEYEETVHWLGRDFNPDEFHPKRANVALAKFKARRPKKRALTAGQCPLHPTIVRMQRNRPPRNPTP